MEPQHTHNQKLRIGGFVPMTSTDLPGMLSAVIFCQGCPWQCRYCHNPHLITTTKESRISWDEVRAFLRKRKGLLDAVVFSGGEPTMQPELIEAVKTIHQEGFVIGLHTAGQYPERLQQLLPYLSWVGFDVKAPFGRYEKITQRKSTPHDERIQQSLSLLLKADIPMECRTTRHAALLSEEELVTIATSLSTIGVKKYVVQHFRQQGCTDPDLHEDVSTASVSPSAYSKLKDLFEVFEIRT